MQVRREVKRLGLNLHDIRNAGALELRLSGVIPSNGSEGVIPSNAGQKALKWIEDPRQLARPVPIEVEPVPIWHFLDGTQRSLPQYFTGSIPIVFAACAAAVLDRSPDGSARVAKGSLEYCDAWILPLQSGDPNVDSLAERLKALNQNVLDPLHDRDGQHAPNVLHDYSAMEQTIYAAALNMRSELETRVLDLWTSQRTHDDQNGWIVIDGPLRRPIPRAIGLVKSFTSQYLTGPEATDLFRLPEGRRTAAFQIAKGFREGVRTAWYLRLRDAAGQDPRHALVRLETSEEVTDSSEIDAISAALLAERAPRASGDDRWAALIYPIYYLEQILKRYLDASLRDGPAAT
jgi:hypothetical protein